MQAKLKPFALILIGLLAVVLAAANYFMLTQAPFGTCTIGTVGVDLSEYNPLWASCPNYMYYFVGAPLLVGLLLLLVLPNLVTREETAQGAKAAPARPEGKKAAPPPPPAKPTTDAAVQLLALFQREGRLVDFLREDIQPYEDTQIGAAVREIHKACRQVLAEHLMLEPVLNGQEGDEVTIPKGFDPSAIRLTGNVSGEPPFRGSLRHAGWRAAQVRLPAQPAGQDPKIVAPAEVEIP
ncbi:MAG TPA: DUF2760 domain-containing protein [Candidatus Binatia bacterium]|nr:DUF2760 domain-containing protein [Candidatus Binatia bacterium]